MSEPNEEGFNKNIHLIYASHVGSGKPVRRLLMFRLALYSDVDGNFAVPLSKLLRIDGPVGDKAKLTRALHGLKADGLISYVVEGSLADPTLGGRFLHDAIAVAER